MAFAIQGNVMPASLALRMDVPPKCEKPGSDDTRPRAGFAYRSFGHRAFDQRAFERRTIVLRDPGLSLFRVR
jgi:hypothetical protein